MSARGRSTGTNTRQRYAWSRARHRSARATYSCPGATVCTAASPAARPDSHDRSVVSSVATLPNTCRWGSADSTSTSCLPVRSRTRCAQAIPSYSRCPRCARRAVVSAQTTASRFRRALILRGGVGAEGTPRGTSARAAHLVGPLPIGAESAGASFTPIARRAMDEGASARAMVASGCLENRWHGGAVASRCLEQIDPVASRCLKNRSNFN